MVLWFSIPFYNKMIYDDYDERWGRAVTLLDRKNLSFTRLRNWLELWIALKRNPIPLYHFINWFPSIYISTRIYIFDVFYQERICTNTNPTHTLQSHLKRACTRVEIRKWVKEIKHWHKNTFKTNSSPKYFGCHYSEWELWGLIKATAFTLLSTSLIWLSNTKWNIRQI